MRQVCVGFLNTLRLGYAKESKMIEIDAIVHAHDTFALIETRHHPQALDLRMHSGLFQGYHAYSSGVVGHGPGSLSGLGVTVLVHGSLVPKVLGCKVSAPGAVVQGVWLEVHATGTLVFEEFGLRQWSAHAYKLSIIGCSEQSVLIFIVAKPASSWPKSVLTVVLQLKDFCQEPYTHMRL
jgi:hypothetical protein